MQIDPRIDGSLKDAPVWAKALIAMTAALLGGDRTKDAIDTLSGTNEADYTVTVQGRRLVSWIGISRSIMEKEGLDDDAIAEVRQALAERGQDVTHLDKPATEPEAKPEPKAAPISAAGSVSGVAITADAGHPKTVAGGHLVKDLAGKPYDELLAIDGIGPKLAERLSKLTPGTDDEW